MKHPFDMTLDELYEELLDNVRNEKPERNRGLHKTIDAAKGMLRGLGLCQTCNIRRTTNQWSIYCHATCFPQNHRPMVEPEDAMTSMVREKPPTVREMMDLLDRRKAAEDRELVRLTARVQKGTLERAKRALEMDGRKLDDALQELLAHIADHGRMPHLQNRQTALDEMLTDQQSPGEPPGEPTGESQG